jgi:phosphomannomutase
MAPTHPTDLFARARAWLDDDPDPATRAELADLLARAECDDSGEAPGSEQCCRAWSELAGRFVEPLQFGTAGLRGAIGAGPNRMNRAVVIRTTAGLAGYLKNRHSGGGEPPLVVVGHDARHRSEDFARDAVAVLAGAGLRAALLPGPLPTPVLAYAVRSLDAAAGIAVTASHNPAGDNGYKVFLGGPDAGSQLVPPAEAEIAERIEAVGPTGSVPLAAEGWEVLDDSVVEAYLDRAAGVVDPASPRDLAVVYTPLHGVGRNTFNAAFKRAGFPPPTVVTEQGDPDPDFPTLPFPNPEEPGAMALAFRTASAIGPDLVLANDPDADRCAVAVPDHSAGGGGGWRMLTGDEVGALIAAHLVHRRAQGTFATSVVSSSVLERIADAAGLPYAETLTGFKWLTRVPGLRYAYEEALGYCVDPDAVRDKDGITASLLICELAAELKESGRTLQDLLDDLALAYGLHATEQVSVRLGDPKQIADAMARLREAPPEELAGLRVSAVDDLAVGSAGLPPAEGLRYRLAGGGGTDRARVVVRPSGTEPKLKCYLEVVLPVRSSADLSAARASAKARLGALGRDVTRAAGLAAT